ncbi:uncharacterized protein F4807DRAFT_316855 [Annulohypoxylon truncatum]|uniref:uncharacterized protein n=1 Tax=Annulohypoxylon truncatum TaxID=327061 RepID=UPI00200849C0|nr:uncharacterized protein F4807DRAFT_316855 [Annulohypoxylon truncatum]KAI1204775.1 hypothetical protein F4807DRAFT_316855 [Annulohypoxylon truncatum]
MGLYEIDPDGDVLLTLHNPNAPFAVWVPETEPEPEPEPEPQPEHISLSKESLYDKLRADDTDPTCSSPPVQFLVSSRHLVLASKYFRSILQGPWEEGTVIHSDGRRHISAQDWDEIALSILMHVIHGRNRIVRRSITLEMFAKIAVLVDYYSCHEAVEPWLDIWEASLTSHTSEICDRSLVLQILISSIFEKKERFRDATKIAVEHCKKEFPTLELPIVAVAEKINQRRQEHIRQIFDCIYSLCTLSSEDSIGCNFACSSMLLGSLIIQMRKQGLDSKPEPPYIGYSVASTRKMIHEFETPRWNQSESYNRYGNGSFHRCTLSDLLRKNLPSGEVEGLELKDICTPVQVKKEKNKKKKKKTHLEDPWRLNFSSIQ